MTDPLKMSKYVMKDEDALGLAKIDLGFSTDRDLKQMAGKVSEKIILEFRIDERWSPSTLKETLGQNPHLL